MFPQHRTDTGIISSSTEMPVTARGLWRGRGLPGRSHPHPSALPAEDCGYGRSPFLTLPSRPLQCRAVGCGWTGKVTIPPNHCLFVVVLILKELKLISASYLGRPKSGTESHFVMAYILPWFTQVRTPSSMPPARFQAFPTFLLQPGMGQITEFWGNGACFLRPPTQR